MPITGASGDTYDFQLFNMPLTLGCKHPAPGQGRQAVAAWCRALAFCTPRGRSALGGNDLTEHVCSSLRVACPPVSHNAGAAAGYPATTRFTTWSA